MKTKLLLLALVCISVIFTGCGDSDSDDSISKTIDVFSSKGVCFGVTQSLCMRYGAEGASENNAQLFFGEIEGFNYQWGRSYSLLIKETPISNPPADGSNIRTELVSILTDQEDEVGTAYNFESITLLEATITSDEQERFFFLGDEISCPEVNVCEELVDMANMDAIVNLRFEYQGEGVISLIDFD